MLLPLTEMNQEEKFMEFLDENVQYRVGYANLDTKKNDLCKQFIKEMETIRIDENNLGMM